MILQNILKYRNDSNFAQTLLSTIKSSGANPPEKNFFLIMLTSIFTCENKGGKIPIYTFLLHILKLHNEQFSNFAITRMSLLNLYFSMKNK